MPWKNSGNESVYDAKKFKRRCPQLITDEDSEYLKKNWEVAEDCLYLNVFTLSVRNVVYSLIEFYGVPVRDRLRS